MKEGDRFRILKLASEGDVDAQDVAFRLLERGAPGTLPDMISVFSQPRWLFAEEDEGPGIALGADTYPSLSSFLWDRSRRGSRGGYAWATYSLGLLDMGHDGDPPHREYETAWFDARGFFNYASGGTVRIGIKEYIGEAYAFQRGWLAQLCIRFSYMWTAWQRHSNIAGEFRFLNMAYELRDNSMFGTARNVFEAFASRFENVRGDGNRGAPQFVTDYARACAAVAGRDQSGGPQPFMAISSLLDAIDSYQKSFPQTVSAPRGGADHVFMTREERVADFADNLLDALTNPASYTGRIPLEGIPGI